MPSEMFVGKLSRDWQLQRLLQKQLVVRRVEEELQVGWGRGIEI